MKRKNEGLQKMLLIVFMGLFFCSFFIRPQYNQYRDNQNLLENKQKILETSHLEISEDEYLRELNHLQMELERYYLLIPEEEEQEALYQGLKRVIEKSEVELMDLYFSDHFRIETNDRNELFDEEKKNEHSQYQEKELHGIPIKIQIEGNTISIKNFFNGLKDVSPLLTIQSFEIEEGASKTRLNLEMLGYFFGEEDYSSF